MTEEDFMQKVIAIIGEDKVQELFKAGLIFLPTDKVMTMVKHEGQIAKLDKQLTAIEDTHEKRIKRLESQKERLRSTRELFERKYIDYRNEMMKIRNEQPTHSPLHVRLTHFMQEKQEDVNFHD